MENVRGHALWCALGPAIPMLLLMFSLGCDFSPDVVLNWEYFILLYFSLHLPFLLLVAASGPDLLR